MSGEWIFWVYQFIILAPTAVLLTPLVLLVVFLFDVNVEEVMLFLFGWMN
jgi:hypothetical protein